MTAESIQIAINVRENISKVMGSLNKSTLNVKKTMTAANSQIAKLRPSIQQVNNDLVSSGGLIGMATAAAGIAFPIQAAASYESAIVDIARAVSMTTEQEKELLKELMNMRGGSVESLAEIAAGLGRAGVQYKDLSGVTKIVNKGVIALGLSAEETTDSIAAITNLNQWTMTADVVGRVGDLFAHLENTMAKVKAADLSNVWGRTASSFKAAGIAAAESQAGIAAWSMSMHRSPELAAQTINLFVRRLPKASQVFERLTGKSVDFYAQLKKEGPQAFLSIVNQIKSAGLSVRSLQKIMGQAGGYRMFQLLSDPASQNQFLSALDKAKNATGAMDIEFQKSMGTFKQTWATLVKQAKNFMAVGGAIAMNVVTPLVKALSVLLVFVRNLTTRFPLATKIVAVAAVVFVGLMGTILALSLTITGLTRVWGVMSASMLFARQGMLMFLIYTKQSILWTNSLIPRVWALVTAKRGLALATFNYARLVARNPISMFGKGLMGAISGIKSLATGLRGAALAGGLLALPLIKVIAIIGAIIGIFMLLKKYWRDIIHFFRWIYNNTLAPVMGAIYNSFVDIVNFVMEKFGKEIAIALKSVAIAGAELLHTVTFGAVDYRKEAQSISLSAIEHYRMEKKDFTISEAAMDQFLDNTADAMGAVADGVKGAFSDTMGFITGVDDEADTKLDTKIDHVAKNQAIKDKEPIKIDMAMGLEDKLSLKNIKTVSKYSNTDLKLRTIEL